MRPAWPLLVAAFSAASLALAQTLEEPAPDAGFDCWIGNSGGPYFIYYIRCIVDRDMVPAPSPDTRFDAVLEQLHRELHDGSSTSVEKMFQSNIGRIKESGGVWNIPIYSYPAEWSWEEGRPERLVRAGLCPPDRNCSVFIHRH